MVVAGLLLVLELLDDRNKDKAELVDEVENVEGLDVVELVVSVEIENV